MRKHPDTRARVHALLLEGKTLGEIAAELGISKPTVCFHKRRLGFEMQRQKRYDWPEVQRYYDEGHSITECQKKFGMCRKTFYDATLRGDVVTRPQGVAPEELFVAGRRRNRGHLKQRLLRLGLKVARCEDCGLDSWRGRPLSLELHHVNGDGEDNRLENLRILCPNCHSQTATWGGRNRRAA